jgi:tryptophan synthase beta subunit
LPLTAQILITRLDAEGAGDGWAVQQDRWLVHIMKHLWGPGASTLLAAGTGDVADRRNILVRAGLDYLGVGEAHAECSLHMGSLRVRPT